VAADEPARPHPWHPRRRRPWFQHAGDAPNRSARARSRRSPRRCPGGR
jgi:hypothetical protein